jgi:hypothetical protein
MPAMQLPVEGRIFFLHGDVNSHPIEAQIFVFATNNNNNLPALDDGDQAVRKHFFPRLATAINP